MFSAWWGREKKLLFLHNAMNTHSTLDLHPGMEKLFISLTICPCDIYDG
jgi:hypothetical protein